MAKRELASAAHPLEQRIHIVRGQKILLDTDLAALYQVQPFRLNEAVKRNRKRFPEDFMFPAYTSRGCIFDIAICDVKDRTRRPQNFALCLH